MPSSLKIQNYAAWIVLQRPHSSKSSVLPRIGLSSVLRPRQHSIGYMGDGFYRSKDPTNSIKVLKVHIVHRNKFRTKCNSQNLWQNLGQKLTLDQQNIEFSCRHVPLQRFILDAIVSSSLINIKNSPMCFNNQTITAFWFVAINSCKMTLNDRVLMRKMSHL